jgi:hypothetical protein
VEPHAPMDFVPTKDARKLLPHIVPICISIGTINSQKRSNKLVQDVRIILERYLKEKKERKRKSGNK